MKNHYLRSVFVLFIFLIAENPSLFAQNAVSKWIGEVHKNSQFSEEKFIQLSKIVASNTELSQGTSFIIDPTKLSSLWANPKPALTLTFPVNGTYKTVELARVQVLSADFKVSTNGTSASNSLQDEGVHYRGVVKDDTESIAAISIYKNEMRGFISDKTGKYEIGKIKDPKLVEHIIYETADLKENLPFSCGSNVETMSKSNINSQNLKIAASGIGCKTVKVFFECDYQMFLDNGSNVSNVTNYVSSFFNQVATIYQNENIDIQISEIHVWTTPDPYRALTSTGAVLQVYDVIRGSNFNGNLAHFLTTRNIGGGVAYVNVLCNKSYAHGVSMIYKTFATYPSYSWTVNCVTHELGHNFGSNHTQWCGWVKPDGTTGPLDNCGAVEGNCNIIGPTPTNGGTVMSYCHQTKYGVNLANGFGQLPGNVIRQAVTNATCLAASASTTAAPTGQQTTNILNNGATLSWNAVPNVASYSVDYKASNSSVWVNLGSFAGTTATLTGLLSGTSYHWRLKADCSAYSNITSFTTAGTPACVAPSRLTNSNIKSTSATLSWGLVSGATDYIIQYKKASETAWITAATVASNSYSLTGLTAGTAYNWQVKANCSGYSITGNVNTIAAVCFAPIDLKNINVASASATLLWSSASGATNYTIQYKKTTATTWTTAATVASNSYSLTGLTASTAYNWQVKASCSGYSAIVNFSTISAVCSAPINLSSGSIGGSSAKLSWGLVSGASNYTIQYKKATATTWTTAATITTNSYNLAGLTANTAYNWQIKSNCSGYSAAANFSTISAVCAAPIGLVSSNVASTSAILTWGIVSGATNYTIQYKKSTATTWIIAATVTGNLYSSTNSYSLTGLAANTVYDWQVKASCSTYSSIANFSTSTNICLAPVGLVSSNVANTSAILTWGSVSGAVNYTIQYKKLTATSWTTAATIATNSYSLMGLEANTSYTWQVKANCSGYSSISNFSTSTICAAPTALVSSNVASTSAILTWGIVSGATNYTIQYKKSTATTWTTAATVTGNLYSTTNSYSLTGLAVNTAYTWQIKANCSGYSTPSNFSTSSLFCFAPTGLSSINSASTSTTLVWKLVSGASSYTIQYKKSTATTWTTGATITSNAYSLTGLTAGTTYNWQVKASCSAYSTTASLTTIASTCVAPASLASSNLGSTSATLSWGAVSGATNYTIQYKTTSATTWTTAASVTSTNYSLTGLTASTAYNWQVKASCSAYSTTVNLTTIASTCVAPVSLVSSNVGSTSASLSWGAVSGATNYTIQYRRTSTSAWTTAATVVNTSYNLTGLKASTAYNWQVKASCSGYSTVANFSTFSSSCVAPSGLSSTNITSGSATLVWNAVSGATNYTIQYKKSTSSAWTTAATVTTNNYNLTGLVASTAYNWQVKASCSSYSATVNLTTISSACFAPIGLSSTNITSNAATLVWNAVSGATNYTLQYKTAAAIVWTTAATVTTTNYNLAGLTASTAYNWQIKASCSGYSTTVNFSTIAAAAANTCVAPTGLLSTNLFRNSATLSWNNVSGATNYTLQYKLSTAVSWTTVATVTANAYSLTGLAKGKKYDWRVKTNCSAYTSTATFVTPNANSRVVMGDFFNDDFYQQKEKTFTTEVIKFAVYPNPAQDNISLNITNDEKVGEAFYRIVDFRGNVRKVQQIKDTTENIDISSLERGTYIIQMFSKSGIIESKTLIKEQ